jgi:membrane dipeptidase
MNRLGMIVDLSHAGDTTAQQGIAASRAPVIFSHSAARKLADTPRNVSDATLRRLVANGGMIMVPLAPYLITTEHWKWWSGGEAHYNSLVKTDDDAAIKQKMAAWDRANPEPRVTVAQVADQIEHITRIVGHAHVGIGTDFDGMGNFEIIGLQDAAHLQALFSELRGRGWTDQQLNAIGTGNFERVLREVEVRASR